MEVSNLYCMNSRYKSCFRNSILFPLFIIFLLFSLLLSCLSTPEVDENSDNTANNESENSGSKSTTSSKKTDDSLSDSGKTKTSRTSSNKKDSGLGNLFGINFTTYKWISDHPKPDESSVYIFFYVALFSFIYLAIIIRIIRRRKKK